MTVLASKKSNFIGSTDVDKLKNYLTDLDQDVRNLFQMSAPIFFGYGTSNSVWVNEGGWSWGASGYIGGWNVTDNLLWAGTASTYIGLQPGVGIWAGDEAFASGVFSVDPNGVIKAHSGEIGGWRLGTTTISDYSSVTSSNIVFNQSAGTIEVGNDYNTYITIDGTNRYIQTSDFVSGALGTGWKIAPDLAEFQNVRVRGKITTSVFEKDSISSIGGSLLIEDSDILNTDMGTSDTSTLTITGDTTFGVNDILRINDGTNEEWMTVTTATTAPTYTVTRDNAENYAANANPAWKKGTAVVNYGVSGEGGIFMTASEANAPYIHFFTHTGSPWNTTTPKTRIGNLTGIAGCSGYGLWGGAGFLGALQVIDIISIGVSGEIKSNTAGNYPYIAFSNSGLQLKDADTGGTYNYATYSTDNYGFGALAWLMNSSFNIPYMELKEPTKSGLTVASMRLYNRSANPTGIAEIGDLAIVSGKLKICTSAGTGTAAIWTIVGTQS